MKTLKLTLITLLTGLILTSCVVIDDTPNHFDNETNTSISLDRLLLSKDLWYIDSNQTYGSGDVRFLSLAFTLSFQNGKVFANNNLVGIGSVGNGLGDQIGYYSTNGTVLEIDHDLDGYINLEVIQTSYNRIKLRSLNQNVTYQLTGYNRNEFDFDAIFYDNIEFFLQEYMAWEKIETAGGVVNDFDNENFLAFIPENRNTFLSSQDLIGTNIDSIIWDFSGAYEVFDVQGYENLKIIELNYDNYGIEEFELTIENDGVIVLYHYDSDTTYTFEGIEQIIYKKQAKGQKKTPRKRFKVTRKLKVRKTKTHKTSDR
jgi:hypothetical protein